MEKIIVIGANHAGTAFINTILDNSTDKEVIVFDANSNISFLGCGMALWIGNQIAGPEGLFYSTPEILIKKGATIHMETPVDLIDFEKKVVYGTHKNGEKIVETYDRLVLATGSQPIVPNIPGKNLENVQFVKRYQDAQEVIEKIKNPSIKNIVVVGAGYIGVELAEAFQRHGKNITLIDIANDCLSSYYDDPFKKMMKDNLTSHGVHVAFGEAVTEIKGTHDKVSQVLTNNACYDADMVVLAIGFHPNTALGNRHLDVFHNDAYLVNLHQQTSMPDVYAIGDCATVYDNAIKDNNYIALATNAVRSGLVAAFNILGNDTASVGVQGSNGICIYNLKMVSTGLTYEKACQLGIDAAYTDYEDQQKPAFITHDNPTVNIRIVYDKNTRVILGAQMASTYDISMGIHMFSLAVQEGITIDTLALTDIFFLPHFNKPYNYITMAAISAKS